MTDDSIVTITEAADRSGISKRTLYRWIQNGTLTEHKIERRAPYLVTSRVGIDLDELDRVMNEGATL